MITIYVHLGAGARLEHCDILAAYSVLLAGRLILAGHISARTDGDPAHEAQTLPVLRACSGLLRRFALQLPIAQGAAEVFDETCRVCRVSLPSSSPSVSQPRYAWYRPVRVRKREISASRADATPQHARAPHQPASRPDLAPAVGNAVPDNATTADLSTLFSPPDTAFASGNFALPFNFSSSTAAFGDYVLPGSGARSPSNLDDMGSFDASEFSWLLPGGNIPYYFPDEQS